MNIFSGKLLLLLGPQQTRKRVLGCKYHITREKYVIQKEAVDEKDTEINNIHYLWRIIDRVFKKREQTEESYCVQLQKHTR